MVGLYSTLFIGVQLFQRILHCDAIRTGFALLPLTLAVAVMSLWVTAWSIRLARPKCTVLVGVGALLVGLALFESSNPATMYFPQVLFAMVFVGVGAGLDFTLLFTVAVANIPHGDAGRLRCGHRLPAGVRRHRRRRTRSHLERTHLVASRQRGIGGERPGRWILAGLHHRRWRLSTSS